MEGGAYQRPAGSSAGNAGAGDHRYLLEYFEFRLRTTAAAIGALIALAAPTFLSWWSDNPQAGSAPAGGLIDRWTFWAVLAHTQGSGGAVHSDGQSAGFLIGTAEASFAWLVAIPLAVTLIAVVVIVIRGGWVPPLVTAISGGAAFAFILAERVMGGSDHQGYPRWPHSYNTGPGITLALWMVALVVVWALCVMNVARRDWRTPPGGRPRF
jgi:hypothetical protein